MDIIKIIESPLFGNSIGLISFIMGILSFVITCLHIPQNAPCQRRSGKNNSNRFFSRSFIRVQKVFY